MNGHWAFATIPLPSRADELRVVPVAHPVCHRIDLLVDNEDGATADYYLGTPAASPVPPLLPAGVRAAARITVPAMGAGDPTVLWLNEDLRSGKLANESLHYPGTFNLSRSAPPPLDSWDKIVGIPLDRWMACRTPADLKAACEARDRGDYAPRPSPPCPCPCECDDCFEWVDITTAGSVEVQRIRGRRINDCRRTA